MIKFIIKIFDIIFLYLIINSLFNFNNLKYKTNNQNKIKEQTIIKKDINKKETKEIKTVKITNKYWGFIEIPKLNLYYGFYNSSDKNNEIKNGIEVMSGSEIPSENGSNIVLVAHSGIGYNILFDRLDVLNLEDEVNLYFNQSKYRYKVKKISKKDKKDVLSLIKSKNNTLMLITCDKQEKEKNLIVYLELIKL
jgi:sortase family protein